MNRDQFQQLIHSIFSSTDEEIVCSEFFDQLPHFVDLRLAGRDASALLPQVHHHLGQCPECNEVYEALLETARSQEPPAAA